MKLVDMRVLGTRAAMCGGSSPPEGKPFLFSHRSLIETISALFGRVEPWGQAVTLRLNFQVNREKAALYAAGESWARPDPQGRANFRP